MLRRQIFAALAGALLASPLHAAPGDIPEKRLFGKDDKYEAAPKAASVISATSTRTTASTTPASTQRAENHATRMSPGNERIATAIAMGALAEHGIHNPTREQLKAALNGGTVTTESGERVTMPGVLKLRASGMGWGQIAQRHGFKLGEVMRHHKDRKHERVDGKHHGRPDFHRTKYERPEKFERPHKHERPERPEKHHRGR